MFSGIVRVMSLGLLLSSQSSVFGVPAQSAQSSGSIVFDPPGTHVYLVNPESGFVSVIDTHSDQVIREAYVGMDSHCLALSPDGQYILTTNRGFGTLAILDAASLQFRASVSVDPEPYGVVIHPVSGLVYIASSALSVIDVAQITFDDEFFSDRPIGLVSSRKARRNRLSVTIIDRIPVSSKPKGLAISGDGNRLYVTHFLSGEVSIIDTATRRVLQVVSTGPDTNMSQKIAIHPNNGRAYLPQIRSNVTNPFLLFGASSDFRRRRAKIAFARKQRLNGRARGRQSFNGLVGSAS